MTCSIIRIAGYVHNHIPIKQNTTAFHTISYYHNDNDSIGACSQLSALHQRHGCPQAWARGALVPPGNVVKCFVHQQLQSNAKQTNYLCIIYIFISSQRQHYLHNFSSVPPLFFAGRGRSERVGVVHYSMLFQIFNNNGVILCSLCNYWFGVFFAIFIMFVVFFVCCVAQTCNQAVLLWIL